MTSDQIVAMLPGPELDRLIHEHVFGKVGRRKQWSTTTAALEILEQLPLAAGLRPVNDPSPKKERPYWAGTVEHIEDEESGSRYSTPTRLFSNTLPLAICKMALIEVFSRKPQT